MLYLWGSTDVKANKNTSIRNSWVLVYMVWKHFPFLSGVMVSWCTPSMERKVIWVDKLLSSTCVKWLKDDQLGKGSLSQHSPDKLMEWKKNFIFSLLQWSVICEHRKIEIVFSNAFSLHPPADVLWNFLECSRLISIGSLMNAAHHK